MRIDFRKVEFTGEQIDNCFDGVISSITLGFRFSSLENGVEPFQYSVTDFVIKPTDNAIPMMLHGISSLLNRVDTAMGSPEIPFPEQLVEHLRSRSLVYLLKCLKDIQCLLCFKIKPTKPNAFKPLLLVFSKVGIVLQKNIPGALQNRVIHYIGLSYFINSALANKSFWLNILLDFW